MRLRPTIQMDDGPGGDDVRPGAEVIAFTRPRGAANMNASAPEVVPGDVRLTTRSVVRGWRERARPAALILASVLLHGAVFAMAVRERAEPLSIGEQAITVEIVVGGDVAAGLAATPSEAEAAHSVTETAEREEIEPPQHVAERGPVPPDPPREDAPVPVAEAPQPVEEPAPVVAAAAPEKTDAVVERAPEVAPQAKSDTAQTKSEITPPPKPAENKSDKKPEKKPEKPARTAAVSAPASSGVGRGRSDADVNYQGRIVAHLARHKRYPADARARRDEGSAMVRFSIDGGGQVTAVAVTKASGFAALDRETEAMVRRASPFPAPPDGRPRTFSAPVSFRLE